LKEDKFIKKPYFKGGDKAMKDFISENMVLPPAVISGQIKGEVIIQYDISISGNVIDTRIISGLDDSCNAEAVRLVKLLKFIVPKNPRKLKLTFHKTIRIHFHSAPQPKQKAESSQEHSYHYNFVPTLAPEEPKETAVFSYSIAVHNASKK